MSGLGTLLRGLIPDDALERAASISQDTGESLPVVLSRLALVPDEDVVEALSDRLGIRRFDPEEFVYQPSADYVPDAYWQARRAVPLVESEDTLSVAAVDPTDTELVSGLQFASGKTIDLRIIAFQTWRELFDERTRLDQAEASTGGKSVAGAHRWADDQGGMRDLNLDAPAVRLAETLLSDAASLGASDLHIERKPNRALVRMRVDGSLHDRQSLDPSLAEALIARFKVLGDLDVADHRRTQDGRTTVSAGGRPIDIRLATIPSTYGEGVVIRLLSRSQIELDLEVLGFSPSELARVSKAIKRPQGLYLVSGPTGGGKTTTLYAALNSLRRPDRKIVTIEDPIEYFFEDIHQTSVDAAAGLDFASALRAFLRYDPDIILVGEIRDEDTARTAIQAGLTGHLVLSTLHARDAASVPARLIDMGVEPYLLAATLSAASAQRLVRRLCEHCKEPTAPPGAVLAAHPTELEGDQWCRPVGCEHCSGGYRGRLVISETLVADNSVRDRLRDDVSPEAFRRSIETSMLQDGLSKASLGLTTVDEVLAALETS